MGLIATRSLDGTVTGMSELVLKAQERIASGVIAYDAVQRLKVDPQDPAQRARFEAHKRDLGYALLLKRKWPIRAARRRSRSRRRHGTRCPMSACSSGAFASWRGSALR
jgi:hypothetical protein